MPSLVAARRTRPGSSCPPITSGIATWLCYTRSSMPFVTIATSGRPTCKRAAQRNWSCSRQCAPRRNDRRLELARRPAARAHGHREVARYGGRGGADVADTHLHLGVARAGTVILREEHQQLVGDQVGVVGVPRQGDLAGDGFLGGRDCHLFAVVGDDQLARL